MLVLALLCALLPLAIAGVLLISTSGTGGPLEGEVSDQVMRFTEDQLRSGVDAHALRIETQLAQVAYRTRLLRTYALQILAAPDVYCTFAGVLPGTDDAENETTPAVGQAPTALDNPVYYVRGEDGAYRKPIDDGGPTIFYRAREDGGDFSPLDLRRLYATAALDPLLEESVTSDPVATQAFLITKDNLLRTYPFRDFSLWPADKSLTNTTHYAWSPAKADSEGLVWTKPYQSHLTGQWVVACLGSVRVGGQQAAVVGIEIGLSDLPGQLLAFSLGTGGMCWLDLRHARNQDDGSGSGGDVTAPVDGPLDLVLTAQTRGEELLGVKPVGEAELPTEKHRASSILDEATLQLSGKQDIADALAQLSVSRPDTHLMPNSDPATYIVSAPVGIAGWVLCGLVERPVLTAVQRFEATVESDLSRTLGIMLAVLVLGLLLAFGMAWLESRRLVHPISVLTQQVRQATASRMTSSVSIADEGELGTLADAVQELVDMASVRQIEVQAEDEADTEES